jgi:hypothetical protein
MILDEIFHSSVADETAPVLPPPANADVCKPVPPKLDLAVAKAVVVVQLVPFQDSVNPVGDPLSPPKAKAAV